MSHLHACTVQMAVRSVPSSSLNPCARPYDQRSSVSSTGQTGQPAPTLISPMMTPIHAGQSVLSEHVLHTHARLTALFPRLRGSAGTRKAKPIWIFLKQETVSGSGISWAICTSAPRSRQPHQHFTSQFVYRPDALPAAQATASKH